MAFIIPNATETGSGQKYANINQAEPDSVDIEALGNRPNWVRSGCVVSITSEQVLVTSGSVVVGNVPYAVAAVTSGIAIPRATIGARTDLVVARKSGATITVQVVTGVDTATNPIFPRSKTIVENLFNGAFNYDPDNDVLLASIYVTSAETDANNLVDKRIVSAEPVVRYSSSTAAPTSSTFDVIGDVVVSGNGIVYVKTGPATWEAIATRTYADTAGFPVGSIFAWSGQTGQTPGANYLECTGQEVLISSYPALYAVVGSIYGTATVNHFRIPNLSDDRTIIGSTSNYGQSGGQNSVVIYEANVPVHDHDVSVNAHANLSHTGASVAVPPVGTPANQGGDHVHKGGQHTHRGALVYRAPINHNNHHVTSVSSHSDYSDTYFHVDALDVNESEGSDPYGIAESDAVENVLKEIFKTNSDVNTALGGRHGHTLTIPNHNNLNHVVNKTPFGSASPTPVNTLPKHIKMRWYIRAL